MPDTNYSDTEIANIKMLKQSIANSIIVPIDAVIDSESGRYVFVANNDIASKVDITIEAIQGENVLVKGLKPNDQLIIMGQRSLSNGDTLNIVQ